MQLLRLYAEKQCEGDLHLNQERKNILMNTLDIIRAWKDELLRKSLTNDEQTLLPDHPAGEMVLSEAEISTIIGGFSSVQCIGTTENALLKSNIR